MKSKFLHCVLEAHKNPELLMLSIVVPIVDVLMYTNVQRAPFRHQGYIVQTSNHGTDNAQSQIVS